MYYRNYVNSSIYVLTRSEKEKYRLNEKLLRSPKTFSLCDTEVQRAGSGGWEEEWSRGEKPVGIVKQFSPQRMGRRQDKGLWSLDLTAGKAESSKQLPGTPIFCPRPQTHKGKQSRELAKSPYKLNWQFEVGDT